VLSRYGGICHRWVINVAYSPLAEKVLSLGSKPFPRAVNPNAENLHSIVPRTLPLFLPVVPTDVIIALREINF
ncbi:hypothetical protein, partial [Faecalibaculum rodentium]|uniref:hypothetical protein n=1 Tax=Faecalibaculum rodentium TaxID=1702221 RepID=UPI002627AAD4